MEFCTHKTCKAPLDAAGQCTGEHKGYAQGGRTKLPCPLCKGSKHSGQVSAQAESFLCAWRQWSTAEHGVLEMPFNPDNALDFARWFDVRASLEYGRAAQDRAWKSSAVVLPVSVAARAGVKVEPPPVPVASAPCLVHGETLPCARCEMVLAEVKKHTAAMDDGNEWGTAVDVPSVTVESVAAMAEDAPVETEDAPMVGGVVVDW
jgi:hypothetical protein